jgi:hypothetical protein
MNPLTTVLQVRFVQLYATDWGETALGGNQFSAWPNLRLATMRVVWLKLRVGSYPSSLNIFKLGSLISMIFLKLGAEEYT